MFPFVPRVVARPPKTSSAPSGASHSDLVPQTGLKEDDIIRNLHSERPPGSAERKGKQSSSAPAGEEYALLVCLSLSDFALWSDADVRRTLASGEDGYIPLNYVIEHSVYLSSLTPTPKETVLVKSIRTHAAECLELRLRISEPSRSTWNGTDDAQGESGGYEVRRKDWRTALQQSRNYSKHEWDSRTVYLENIPLQHRSIVGICHFSNSLLSGVSPLARCMQPVQNVWLPPHILDGPNDPPKCKGFALVVLSQSEEAEQLLHQWPWDNRRISLEDIDHTEAAHEAVKFGFRTLSKARWSRLQEEYFSYRQSLLDEIARAEADTENVVDRAMHADVADQPQHASRSYPATVSPVAAELAISPSAPYPRGCLVYVRNVHPETNKTTLRTLLSQAFLDAAEQNDSHGEAIDYVDFNKGMDTCYLRLATPQYAQKIAAFFNSNPKAQAQGLDNGGATQPIPSSSKAITIEVVEGTREELYWNKLPEKIRRQAVEKTIARSTALGCDTSQDHRNGDEPQPEGKHKRKRRKRAV